MDYQNRVGHRTGAGGPATDQEIALDRKERLRRLALETIDLSKDPYIQKTHHGEFECRLCLTLHVNEASYLSHSQGRKHQTNLSRRAAKEKKDEPIVLPQPKKITQHRTVKIGRPAYRVTKMRNQSTEQKALLFEIEYPEIEENITPAHRFMSAFEQRVEPSDPKYQYIIFAADPYENIAFKIPNMEVDQAEGLYEYDWDNVTKKYSVQIHFKKREDRPLPALPHRPSTFLPIGVRW
eukprot:GHVO01064642.1.p1 GENE.GHVO01064642.1~~GHVO01064642.1.p1  ORF type:complete len:237 (+),score=31.72 GHVO01064642.1:29-739(+)